MSAAPKTGRLMIALGLRSRDGAPIEAWCWLAFGVFALWLGTFFYLGSRPGGTAPLWWYGHGRDYLALTALLVLGYGALRSHRARPFLQGRRGRAFLMLILVLGLAPLPFPYPSSHEGHPSPTRFRLPFAGELRVLWGGDDKDANRPAYLLAARRFGVSFSAVQPTTEVATGIVGRAVLAPSAGRVVRVVDDRPEGTEGAATRNAGLGNHIVLESRTGEFVFLFPLAQESATVEVGVQVTPGRELARVGSSRPSLLSLGPHLSMFVLDDSDVGRGEPVPFAFYDYVADDAPIERGVPRGGLDGSNQPRGELVVQAEPSQD